MPQTRQFLDHLYPNNLPDKTHLLVWTIPGKTSHWFTDINEVEKSLESMGKSNIYIGCGLSPKNYGATKRVLAKQVAGIPGFWADIDYGDAGHKGKTYPPDQETALRILDDLPARPTIIIHSGNGLQAWWLWDEPWIFKNKLDHARATQMSKAFGAQLAEAAGKYSVDSVSDLARVLRLPGTQNVKDPKNPKAVRLLVEDGPRWSDHDKFIEQTGIELALIPAGKPASEKPRKIVDGIPTGDPSASRMAILWSVDPQALTVWLGNDAPWLKDQSDSSRDLSVATRAAMAGWPDLEIAQLIRAGRETRNADLKHPGYYDLTVSKATSNASRPMHIREADESLGIDPDNATPETRLEKISELIGVKPPITKITKTDSDPAVYRIYWRGKRMELGDSSGILEANKFRRVMGDLTGLVVKRRKVDAWDNIAQMLFNCVTHLRVGSEGEATSQMKEYLSEYFEAFGGDMSVEWKTRAQERQPFIREVDGSDWVYFSATGHSGLSAYIWVNHNVRIKPAKIAGLLTEIGWTPETAHVRDGDDTFRRNVWTKVVQPKTEAKS
tara:strand:- start:9968 stop:11632 length:1665 start_codon:yes stop_codon:yes gene_type:complete